MRKGRCFSGCQIHSFCSFCHRRCIAMLKHLIKTVLIKNNTMKCFSSFSNEICLLKTSSLVFHTPGKIEPQTTPIRFDSILSVVCPSLTRFTRTFGQTTTSRGNHFSNLRDCNNTKNERATTHLRDHEQPRTSSTATMPDAELKSIQWNASLMD